MRIIIIPLALVFVVLVFTIHAQDYTKLVYSDCGSQSVDIHNIDMTPMPLYNPGPALFTLNATLKRPIGVIQVALNIIRSVSGITLPVKCYIVNGENVGSCTYPDLCEFLQKILTEFGPDNCPESLAVYGIDCTCPFKVAAQRLDIINHPLDLPDATQTAATFLASGNFNITVTITEGAASAPKPYACARVLVTIKQKK